MGRYAFFNTGLEYKFAFIIQDSSDIQKFGGKVIEQCEHEWTQDDIPYIAELLKNVDLDLKIDISFFEKYEQNVDGTYDLENDMKNVNPTYKLGCLIYHQLMYTDVLNCEYED